MTAEKPLGLHEFRSPNQPPLGWNGVYGTVTLLDKLGFPPPVDLEVGGRDSGLVNICLTPAEAGGLSAFLEDYKFTVIASVVEVEGRRGRNPQQAAEQAAQFLDDAISWFGRALSAGDYVTVVPVPSSRSKM